MSPMSICDDVYLMQLACRTGMLFNAPKMGQAPLIGGLMGFTFDAYIPRGNLTRRNVVKSQLVLCEGVFEGFLSAPQPNFEPVCFSQ